MRPTRCLLVAATVWLAAAEFPDLTLVLRPDSDIDWLQVERWMARQDAFQLAASTPGRRPKQEPLPVASALSAHPSQGPVSEGPPPTDSKPTHHSDATWLRQRNPAAHPATHPAEQPATQPAAQPATHPAEQPAAQPAVHPAAQPAAQPAAHPAAHPAAKPWSATADPGPAALDQSAAAGPAPSPTAAPPAAAAAQRRYVPGPGLTPSRAGPAAPARRYVPGPGLTPSRAGPAAPARLSDSAPSAADTELLRPRTSRWRNTPAAAFAPSATTDLGPGAADTEPQPSPWRDTPAAVFAPSAAAGLGPGAADTEPRPSPWRDTPAAAFAPSATTDLGPGVADVAGGPVGATQHLSAASVQPEAVALAGHGEMASADYLNMPQPQRQPQPSSAEDPAGASGQLSLQLQPVVGQTAPAPERLDTAAARHQVAPDMLAMLLQRLEERLVASDDVHRQHATDLRAIQHRQRKEEVILSKQTEVSRTQFEKLEYQVENLQFDLSRMTTMLETVLHEVQVVARGQREQRALLTPGGGKGGAEDTPDAITKLNQQLSQLMVNTELLKGGQRRLGSNIRTIANTTSTLSERADDWATKATVASSLSEMRTCMEHQQIATAVTLSAGDESLPADCSEVQLADRAGRSGIYQVRPRGAIRPMFVHCDLDTKGGGWAVIQHRFNGEEDFFQDWLAYKYGFGNLGGEFWLGNQNIHLLTNHRLNELRVELADFPRERPGYDEYPGSNATASYGAFALGSETEGYSLKILDGYRGNAGDSLKYHAGMKFSTKDMDNDLWKEDSCASAHKGGWWYKGCDSSNLNGLYLNGPVPSDYEYQVAYWYDWRGPLYSLYQTRMMVRPSDHNQRVAAARSRGRSLESGKTAAQHRSALKTVRRGRRRKSRRKGRRHH